MTYSRGISDFLIFIFPTLRLPIFFIVMVMFGNSVSKILKRLVPDEFSLHDVGLDGLQTGGDKTQRDGEGRGCQVACCCPGRFSVGNLWSLGH